MHLFDYPISESRQRVEIGVATPLIRSVSREIKWVNGPRSTRAAHVPTRSRDISLFRLFSMCMCIRRSGPRTRARDAAHTRFAPRWNSRATLANSCSCRDASPLPSERPSEYRRVNSNFRLTLNTARDGTALGPSGRVNETVPGMSRFARRDRASPLRRDPRGSVISKKRDNSFVCPTFAKRMLSSSAFLIVYARLSVIAETLDTVIVAGRKTRVA